MLIIKYGPFGVVEFVILFEVFVITPFAVGVLLLFQVDVLCFVLSIIYGVSAGKTVFLEHVILLFR
jgi:hypothetical protein